MEMYGFPKVIDGSLIVKVETRNNTECKRIHLLLKSKMDVCRGAVH